MELSDDVSSGGRAELTAKEVEDYKTLLNSLVENARKPLIKSEAASHSSLPSRRFRFPYWPLEPDAELIKDMVKFTVLSDSATQGDSLRTKTTQNSTRMHSESKDSKLPGISDFGECVEIVGECDLDRGLYENWKTELYALIGESWRDICETGHLDPPPYLSELFAEHLEDKLTNMLETMFTLRSYSNSEDQNLKGKYAGNWESAFNAAWLAGIDEEVLTRAQRRLEVLFEMKGASDLLVSFGKHKKVQERDRRTSLEGVESKVDSGITIETDLGTANAEIQGEIDQDIQNKRRKTTEYGGGLDVPMGGYADELFSNEGKKKPYEMHQPLQGSHGMYPPAVPIQDVQSFYYNPGQNVSFELPINANPYMSGHLYQQGISDPNGDQSLSQGRDLTDDNIPIPPKAPPQSQHQRTMKTSTMDIQSGDGPLSEEIEAEQKVSHIQYPPPPYLMQQIPEMPLGPPIHTHSNNQSNLPMQFQNVIDSQAQLLAMHESTVGLSALSTYPHGKNSHHEAARRRHRGTMKMNKQTQLLISALEVQVDDDLKNSTAIEDRPNGDLTNSQGQRSSVTSETRTTRDHQYSSKNGPVVLPDRYT